MLEKLIWNISSDVFDAQNLMMTHKSEIWEETNSSFYCLKVCLNSSKFLHDMKSLFSSASSRGSPPGGAARGGS